MQSLRLLLENKYIKNIIALSSGTLIAQLIVISITPIITRIYSPEQLGAYYVVLSIVTMFSAVVNGRYDMSIVTAENDKEAESVAVASLIFGFISTIVIGIGLFLFIQVNNTVFKGVENLVYMSLPILFINGITNVLTSYNNRYRHYKIMASVTVLRSTIKALGQVSLGVLKLGSVGLLLSQLLSSLIGVRKQATYVPKIFDIFRRIKIMDIYNTFKKYRKQPLLSAPAFLMNSLSFSLMTLFINGLYSIEEAGYYSLSYSMLVLPITLISMNVGRVYFSQASEAWRLEGNFKRLYKKTAVGLLMLSIPIFMLLMIFAEKLFEFVFGTGWDRAGLFVAILSPMFAIRLVASCLTLSFVVANKQKIELALQAIFLVETIIIYYLVKIMNLSIEQFLLIYSGVFLITYSIWIIVMLQISKGKNISKEK
ncbi:hypothetical protein SRABI80_04490 [Peribacillus frigoritolerans]|uniref:lipopolysaccharide biosynthesis protein n=1 Tax=Peribacillus frigoritolerans TaxID=450367 RepID=UPI001D488CF4|nr:oligosaccharide flippase family protein [Peribacillus frigoritolerans]CAH0309294.1 hypothetical protein SRABI80_04490 [Peribacillus frigoritolerans]